MACASVAACNTAAPEVVLDGKTGLLIPPQDTNAEESAIGRLAEMQRCEIVLSRTEWSANFRWKSIWIKLVLSAING
jgi:glycosyltransferase involved in cell wall biosynthesis